MLPSKLFQFLKLNNGNFKQSIRCSSDSWRYRSAERSDESCVIGAEIVQGITWWWILWHCWTDWGQLVGHYDYPDPRKWTDAELGIP